MGLSISFSTLWEFLVSIFWPFIRILALFTAAPVLSSRAAPVRVKILLAGLIAFLVAPFIAPAAAGADPLALLIQQILVGTVVGFSMRVIFAAMEYAGDVAGLQIGLGFAMFVDPSNARQTPLVGSLFNLLAILVFLSIGGHLLLIMQLIDSFTVFPLAGPPVPFDFLVIARWGGELFRIGLTLALPIITAILLINLTLGIMARVAPQLSIFSIGFSLTLIVGLAMLTLLVPYLLEPFERYLTMPLWMHAGEG